MALADQLPRVSLDAARAELGRRSLKHFIEFAWPLVEPTTELVWNWHLDELCELLEAVTAGEERRAIINVPPGTSKSLTVSVFWPAWEWATDPSLRYLTASYSDANTIRDNRRVRAIVQSEWYQRHYPARIASDQWAKVRLDTEQKGWRIATSVGGVGTGEHPDRIIVDDPIKATDARSAVGREACLNWWRHTMSTRVASPKVALVIIMQRLHAEDLSGHLLSKGGWTHLMLPMRFDPKRADPRDCRTDAGELLWPDLWPEEKVRQEEIDLGPFGAAGQLQQSPAPEGGGLFKREWLPIVEAAPVQARRCRGWDTAGTEDGGDWTVGVRIAEVEGIYYVEDVVRGQWGPGTVDATMKATAQLDGMECWQREEQEPGSSGKAVIAARVKTLAGYDYAGVSTTGDKVTRARPFRAQAEAGNVKLVKGPWNEEYISELVTFPVGAHDDQVDGTSAAANALMLEREAVELKVTF